MKAMVHTFLEGVANYIENFGWAQGGSGHTGDNAYGRAGCTLVVMSRVAEHDFHYMPSNNVKWLLNKSVGFLATNLGLVANLYSDGLLPGSVGGAVALWNDDPNRTRNQVISSIRAVAAIAKAQDLYVEYEAKPTKIVRVDNPYGTFVISFDTILMESITDAYEKIAAETIKSFKAEMVNTPTLDRDIKPAKEAIDKMLKYSKGAATTEYSLPKKEKKDLCLIL